MDILLKACKSALKERPDKREEILDLYQSVVEEIADGGSEDHEIALALCALEEIVEE